MKIKAINKFFVSVSLIFFVVISGFSQSAISNTVEKIVNNAFLEKSPYSVCKKLEFDIKNLKLISDKKVALSILADYEEKCEFYSRAIEHYIELSSLSSGKDKKDNLLNAIGNALLGGNISLAYDICVKKLLPIIKDPLSSVDAKSLVYLEWINLKMFDNTSDAMKYQNAIKKLKRYVTNPSFKELHPAILLTLWWLENDKKAKNTLLKKYPNSVESGIVKEVIVLSPKAFWYLMPRNEFCEIDFDEKKNSEIFDIAISDSESDYAKKVKVYQIGFFKNKEYANRLVNILREKEFEVFVKSKKKLDTIFYSVLVKSDNRGDLLLRLKNEGYEAVPVIEE